MRYNTKFNIKNLDQMYLHRFICRALPETQKKSAPVVSQKPDTSLLSSIERAQKEANLDEKGNILMGVLRHILANPDSQDAEIQAAREAVENYYLKPKREALIKAHGDRLADLKTDRQASENELYEQLNRLHVDYELLPEPEKNLIKRWVTMLDDFVWLLSPYTYEESNIQAKKSERLHFSLDKLMPKATTNYPGNESYPDFQYFQEYVDTNNGEDDQGSLTDKQISNSLYALFLLTERGEALPPEIKASLYLKLARNLENFQLRLGSFKAPHERSFDQGLGQDTLNQAYALLRPFERMSDEEINKIPGNRKDVYLERLAQVPFALGDFLRDQTKKTSSNQQLKQLDTQICENYKKALENSTKIFPTSDHYFHGYVNYLFYSSEIHPTPDFKGILDLLGQYQQHLTNQAICSEVKNACTQLNWESLTPFWEKLKSLPKIYNIVKSEDYFQVLEPEIKTYEAFSALKTPEERRTMLGKYLNNDNSDPTFILAHAENSPQFKDEYHRIIAGALIPSLGSPAKWAFLKARLYDTWSPPGLENPNEALIMYRKALQMGITSAHQIDNDTMAEGVARCWWLINGPVIAKTGNNPLDEVHDKDKDGQAIDRYEVDHPDQSLIMLYFDKKTNMGVAVQRYRKGPDISPEKAEKLYERWKELRDKKKKLSSEWTEQANIQKELIPEEEEIGAIRLIRIKNGRLQLHTHPISFVSNDPKIVEKYNNVIEFPWAGISAKRLDLKGKNLLDLARFHCKKDMREAYWYDLVDRTNKQKLKWVHVDENGQIKANNGPKEDSFVTQPLNSFVPGTAFMQ
ncbi:TPA: hypothetical protein DGH83_00880 [Candidatus Peregrinibacteria bacterium]|nr:hypothetical protein [Candidatus Peregrinibacteria bacterium]